jgi:hypothetical protein
MSRSTVLLVVVVVLGMAGLALWWTGGETDEERIRTIIRDAAQAAEEKRIDGVVRGLSIRFSGHGLDRRDARQVVAAHVLRGTWTAVIVARDEVVVAGDAARALVDVVLARSGRGTPLAQILPETATVHRFDLRFAREPDGWKVTEAAWRRISIEEALTGNGKERAR